MFEPITITIETKAEADMLWHLLNNAYACSMKNYSEQLDYNFSMGLHESMWRIFNNVHPL